MGASSGHAPHILGGRAERLAVDYFCGTDWTLVERNYCFGHREVDLILQRGGGLLAFVEVRTRAGDRCNHPEETVTWKKRGEIEAVVAAAPVC